LLVEGCGDGPSGMETCFYDDEIYPAAVYELGLEGVYPGFKIRRTSVNMAGHSVRVSRSWILLIVS
jgi:hypothetical protein